MPKDWKRTAEQPWTSIGEVGAESYRCGYCGDDVGSDRGIQNSGKNSFIRICPLCNCPTFFSAQREQWPGPRVGGNVSQIADDVKGIYEEARRSITVNAYTGAVMLCRTILMHVAVEKGAKAGESFQSYVKWLIDEHYVPRGSDGWLDYIRARGNDANHKIVPMDRDDALGVLGFTEALLRNVYELPAAVPATGAKQL